MLSLIKKQTSFSIFFVAALFVLALICIENKRQDIFYSNIQSQAVLVDFLGLKQSNNHRCLTLCFVGDIMLDRGVEHSVKKHGKGDFKWVFSNIADYLGESDLLFGNLESVISDKGANVGSIYSFRAEPEAIEGLQSAGFDVLSVANNHIFDYGREAMEDSFFRLRRAGIDYVGGGFSEQEAHSPVIKEINGRNIAYLAYCNVGSRHWQARGGSSGIAWLDDDAIKDIRKAKQEAEVLIVSMHFGSEYNSFPNENQERFARLAIDAGADLVIGHHPHVVQPVEEYKGGYIAYSLGNFVFDQYFSEETMEGLLLEVIIERGSIKEINQKQVKINSFFQPELKEE